MLTLRVTGVFMMPNIYSSLILVTKKNFSKKDIKEISNLLDSSPKLHKSFSKIYKASYKLFYNNFFEKGLEVQYLGWENEKPNDIGSTRLDVVYVKNKYLDLSSFHIHFNFIEANEYFVCEDKNSDSLKNIVEFLEKIRLFKVKNYPFKSLSAIANKLSDEKKREFTYSISRYLYTSICQLEKDKTIAKWKNDLLTCLWSLLYLQSEGIHKESASKKLVEDSWSSGNFFMNFHQPGALVSISQSFKNETTTNTQWISDIQKCDTPPNNQPVLLELPIDEEEIIWADEYDKLPEYPPLRYLGLVSLEFSGYVEETLRHTYEKTLSIQKSSFLKKLARSITELPQLELSYYKSLNQECLHLPATREYISSLINNKNQKDIYDNLKELKAGLLNTMILILTLIAAILAVPQIIGIIISSLLWFANLVDSIQHFFLQN